MAVNLNGIDLSGAAASPAHKTSAAKGAATSTPEATQQSDSDVSITSTASLLAHLRKTLAAKPAVDQSRVDSISKALAAGTYTVNADKIAHGLIQSERALGQLK